jgi:hypothetical protein
MGNTEQTTLSIMDMFEFPTTNNNRECQHVYIQH